MNHALAAKIYEVTRNIPKGRVAAYADIARAIGRPKAWRHVGKILSFNRDSKIPCHRVVRSDGRAGGFGYPGGAAEKIRRLRKESVVINSGKINLRRFRIKKPETGD